MRLPYSAFIVLTLASAPVALGAQTVVSGEVTGRVSGSDRGALPDAVVTLRALDSRLSREATTDLQGSFTLQFLAPGLYEMRVEAFGYRPVVFPSVRVEAGVTQTMTVSVTRATPPVTEVDTAAPSAAALSRWSGLGPLVSTADLDGGRTLLGGTNTLARFSSALDPSLGSQGLPGELTTQVVDGVPFFQARHPYLHGGDTESPAFPAALLGSTSVLLSPRDVYWLGSASGTLASETRSGMEGGSGDIEGGWSGKPLWSSGMLDFDTPSITSYQAAFHAGFPLVPDTSQVFVAGEVLRQQSPMAARVPDATLASLQGLDASVLDGLVAPNVETVTRASGMARLDKWSESSRFTLRAAGGRLTRTYESYGPGRLGYGVGLPDEATDLSAAMAFTSLYGDELDIELLGGLSLSDRVYGNADGAPAATLVTSGLALGDATGSTANVSRVDVFLSPALHIPLSSGKAKVGATLRLTRHTFDQAFAGDRDLFFADATSLGAGSGVFAEGSSSEVSFSTTTFGLFGQYGWNASPGLRITAGARVDWEKVPASDVTQNAAFLDAAGVANDTFPSRYLQPGGIVAASWDVRGDGRTLLTASASMMNGAMDPAVLHDVIAQDGASTVRRFVGDGVDWPGSGSPSGAQQATILTLLGPDIRAPRTTEMGGGLVQDLGSGWTLRLAGAARRTDFLPRRRNLNLPIHPLAEDGYGRELFGDLQKLGSIVAADVGTNRRFSGFDAVWAVDPDGWSKYWGVSAGLAYSDAATDVFVSYTRSQTTDNWVGAARGLPDAMLDPLLPETAGATWAEGTSDFDVPDRLVAGARLRFDDIGQGAEVSATYTYQTGMPFTPGYRTGVDANGDGSARNDVAFVPDVSTLGELAGTWSCLADQAGTFAERNSCRGPTRSTLNAAVRIGFAAVGGQTVSLTLEGFNLIEDQTGIVDSALLLVSPGQPIQRSADGTTVTVPVSVNPDFGKVVIPATRGRILRVGLRIGG